MSRVLDGEQAPGEQFIAATVYELDVPFDAVFEVVGSVPAPRSDEADGA